MTKKRNKLLTAIVYYAICILKSALKTRRKIVLNIKLDAKHLFFMSSNKI